MRIAHLILAHAHVHQLERLVKRLLHKEADIYIHLDKKTDIAPFLFLKSLSNVFFIKKRFNIRWGGYSMVEATLCSFDLIASSGMQYSYINLLSGQDYPLQPAEDIHRFLKSHPGKAFLEYLIVEEAWQESIPRLFKYHLAYYRFPGWNIVQRWLNQFTKRRTMPQGMVAVGRSQWFTITGEQMLYVLSFLKKNPVVSRFFKLTWGADEFFFQTILYNSPYRVSIVNDNLRFIDWSEGGVSPKTLTVEDADKLLSSGKLYARKFSPSPNDPLLYHIDQQLLLTENQGINRLTKA